MKKLVCLVLVGMLLLSSAACAEDLGIQMVNSNMNAGSDSIDDMQIGSTYTIDDYATIKATDFLTVDYFAQFGEKEDYSVDHNYNFTIWHVASYATSKLEYGSWRFRDAEWKESGSGAQFFWLAMDITNRQKKSISYIEQASVKVIYQDEYEFTGWIRQIDTDFIPKDSTDYGVSRLNGDKADYPNTIVLNPAKTHAIDMLYTGHYVFGCTVPNFVVEDKKSPLRMEIKLGENELTYYIVR